MFCHLYRLLDRTTLALNEFEECNCECKSYIGKNQCKLVDIFNENLTKDKYGWVLESRILFDPPKESKSGLTRYISVIFLMHPAHNDICIVYHMKHNKVDCIWEPGFKFYFNTEAKEFDTLDAINAYLKKNGYLGRKFVMSDFIKIENKE